MLSHLNGFNNEIKPKNGIKMANVNAITANGRANCQNRSLSHFNGVLNKLNNAIKFNSNGTKNNTSKNKSRNGMRPGNNNNPRMMSSAINLNPSRSATGIAIKIPITSGTSPPRANVVRSPKIAGNTAACNRNLKFVNTSKFNRTNGNVSNPLINGIKNKLMMPLIKWKTADAIKNVKSAGTMRLKRSLRTLNNASGNPRSPSVNPSGINTKNSNGHNRGLIKANNSSALIKSFSNGIANKIKLSRSNDANGPRISLRTSKILANDRSPRIHHSGVKNNSNGHSNGLSNANN